MGKQVIDRLKKTLGILLLVLFIATVTAASVSAQKTVDVSIKDNAFNPATVQISKDDTVKWTNMDSADHTVKGSDFDSGIIQKGKSYEHKFTTAGTYDYVCSIHPSMKGTVKVV
jgi:plastocyanin